MTEPTRCAFSNTFLHSPDNSTFFPRKFSNSKTANCKTGRVDSDKQSLSSTVTTFILFIYIIHFLVYNRYLICGSSSSLALLCRQLVWGSLLFRHFPFTKQSITLSCDFVSLCDIDKGKLCFLQTPEKSHNHHSCRDKHLFKSTVGS